MAFGEKSALLKNLVGLGGEGKEGISRPGYQFEQKVPEMSRVVLKNSGVTGGPGAEAS